MPVVGTAGHVDHGKSTLVRALTGRDPDRWAEEKERGLTIDLGFAWTTLASGTDVGFVDVPGHERFIKNMLAGIDAISVALFVVAADEGWMPQSEEHLAILDLLGIDHAIIALTRADLVDADTLELVTLDIDDRLADTSLAGSPIIATSVPEDRGVAELRLAIDAALQSAPSRDLGRPRLWVDRAFTIAGAGTVITGTLVDGSISIEDSLALFPSRSVGRIRSLQSHEKAVDVVAAGNRTAVNIVGLERDGVERGSMLGRDDQWSLTTRFSAEATTVRALGAPLRERGAFHLHLGSGSWPARVRLLEGEALDGVGAIIIEVDDPLPVRWGDRFILREVGRQAVVAGGRVLDPAPPRRIRDAGATAAMVRAAQTPDEAATGLLEARGTASAAQLDRHTGGGTAHDAVISRDRAFSRRHLGELARRAVELVDEFHGANPLRPGIPKARLAEHLDLQVPDLETLVGDFADIEAVGAEVRRTGFGTALGDHDNRAWESARTELLQAGFSPPRRADLGLDVELQHALIRHGDVIEVSAEFFYLPEILDELVTTAQSLADGFSVADFRDLLGITRKHAIPLLEWMDKTGVTARAGDGRTFRS
jgi:selenocysteine-specific elongation factor